jgi:hypothetical protein
MNMRMRPKCGGVEWNSGIENWENLGLKIVKNKNPHFLIEF